MQNDMDQPCRKMNFSTCCVTKQVSGNSTKKNGKNLWNSTKIRIWSKKLKKTNLNFRAKNIHFCGRLELSYKKKYIKMRISNLKFVEFRHENSNKKIVDYFNIWTFQFSIWFSLFLSKYLVINSSSSQNLNFIFLALKFKLFFFSFLVLESRGSRDLHYIAWKGRWSFKVTIKL